MLQDGWQDFKSAGITLVYTRYIPGLEIADSEKISVVYPTSGILTPCRNAIYHAYTCICMFEIMHVSIYYAYTCIYMQ